MTRRRGKRPNEVFLSHSSRDRRSARAFAAALRKHGIRVWYSEAHIHGGAQWHDEIGRALARCDWFVLLLSPHSVCSKWVKFELLAAIEDERYVNRIVPILLRPCEVSRLSWTLHQFQIVDSTRSPSHGMNPLLIKWGVRGTAKPRKHRPTGSGLRRRRRRAD